MGIFVTFLRKSTGMARSVADDNSELDNLLEEILETEKAAKGKRCVTSKKTATKETTTTTGFSY